MKYEEFIDQDIKRILEINRINISDFELLNGELSVDVRKFIDEYTEFKLEEQPLNRKSGEFNEKENKIIINILENETRKRFSIAHELGHALLGHGTSNRMQGNRNKQYNVDEIVQEILANAFAASFLMPKKLLEHTQKKVLADMGIASEEIVESVKRTVVRKMAEYLNVSMEALRYRMDNVGFKWEQ